MIEDIVASFIQGRVRLRHDLLKDPVLTADFLPMLKAFPGIIKVEHKTLTGSLLIEYDPDILDDDAVTALLAQGEEWIKENSSVQENADTVENTKSLCFPSQNASSGLTRAQKRKLFYGGMLTSFVSMLVTGGTGNKKAHYLTGTIFAVLTAMHMWRMRKVI